MFDWLIGIVIFLFAGWMLYRNIKKSTKGKCPACSSKCSCGGENCKCH